MRIINSEYISTNTTMSNFQDVRSLIFWSKPRRLSDWSYFILKPHTAIKSLQSGGVITSRKSPRKMAENQGVNDSTQHPSIATDFNAATKITLYCILLVWSLVGNVIVIALLTLNKNLRSTFNQLILNMAISDLAIPLLSLPMKIAEEAAKPQAYTWLIGGSFGTALCKISFFIADLSPAVSVLSLLVIATERFIVTLFPIRRYMITRKVNYFCIGFTWIASMVLMSPHLYTFKTLEMDGYTYCYSSWEPDFDNVFSQKLFILIVCITAFVIPFLSMTILYSIMLYKLHQNNKTVQKEMLHQPSSKTESRRAQRNRTVFYISISICASFALLWGPYFCIVFVYHFIIVDQPSGETVFFVINYLAFANSAINPCIYFVFLKSFRNGLRSLFRKQKSSVRYTGVIESSRLREERNYPAQESQL